MLCPSFAGLAIKQSLAVRDLDLGSNLSLLSLDIFKRCKILTLAHKKVTAVHNKKFD